MTVLRYKNAHAHVLPCWLLISIACVRRCDEHGWSCYRRSYRRFQVHQRARAAQRRHLAGRCLLRAQHVLHNLRAHVHVCRPLRPVLWYKANVILELCLVTFNVECRMFGILPFGIPTGWSTGALHTAISTTWNRRLVYRFFQQNCVFDIIL